LYTRYEKWKNKTYVERQNNNILQQQINNLQNNNIPQNQIRMVAYGPPIFKGNPGEDPEDFLREFQRYVVGSRINVAQGNAQAPGREEALGLLISCLEGPALNWYNTRVKGKNWKCNNISDNVGVANLTAIRGIAAGNNANQIGGLNTAGEFRRKCAEKIGLVGANIATGQDIIPVGTWDEDWSYAGGEPTDTNQVNPNAGGGFPNVTIAPDIKLGQLIWLLKTAYPTVEHQKQLAVFGQLTQGNMRIEEFNVKIKKIGKLAGMTDEQQREQFIRGLNPMNQYNIRLMAKFHDTQENITNALAETEKFTLSQDGNLTSTPSYSQSPYTTFPGSKYYTEEEINRIVDERSAKHKPSSVNYPTRKNNDDAFLKLEFIAMQLGYPDDAPRDINSINRFIVNELQKSGHDVNYIRKIIKPHRRTYKSTKKSTKKAGKTKRHCSICGKSGHTKSKCTNSKKKKTRKVNYVQANDSSENSSEESVTEESNSDSDEEVQCYTAKRNEDSSETESSENSEDNESDMTSDSEKESFRCYAVKKKSLQKRMVLKEK
jgi:hypothetical protein